MLNILNFVYWNADPVLFSLGPLSVRWYGLAFAVGFILGYYIVARMFRHEGAPERWLGSRLSLCVAKKPASWTFDKLVIPIALVGGLIRLGNLMNSEIYGGPTDLPWGFVFLRNGETVPAHPTQLYEALCYFLLFALLM